ncbi:MAG: hypothetical protein CMH49_04730 [Myxococcales bacterium]|nr:hypothetical protein [Myxococcales bacterium]
MILIQRTTYISLLLDRQDKKLFTEETVFQERRRRDLPLCSKKNTLKKKEEKKKGLALCSEGAEAVGSGSSFTRRPSIPPARILKFLESLGFRIRG